MTTVASDAGEQLWFYVSLKFDEDNLNYYLCRLPDEQFGTYIRPYVLNVTTLLFTQ